MLQNFLEPCFGGVDGDDGALWVDKEGVEFTIGLVPLLKDVAVDIGVELVVGVDVVDAAEFAQNGLAAIVVDAYVHQALTGEAVILPVGDARLRLGRVPECDKHVAATQLL